MSNFIKLTEIRENTQRWPSNTKRYKLAEIIVNSANISVIRCGAHFKKEIKSYKGWPDGLDERIYITEVLLNQQNVYVIGDIENIAKKIGGYSE